MANAMTDPQEIQLSINGLVKAQLEKYHCNRGHLRFQSMDGASILTLNGWREDGQPILIWQTDRSLSVQIARYLDHQDNWAGLVLDADLLADNFAYKPLTRSGLMETIREEQKQQRLDTARQKDELKATLRQRSEKYGPDLAEKVADHLKRHGLLNTHRDYCGMGLEFNGGFYLYGEVWDGAMTKPDLRFPDKRSFVDWLSRQSDASLARLEGKDSFYWGNQVIHRQRLEAFISG